MSIDVIGWDIGGAHLKAVALNPQGQVQQVMQLPCPLWQGLEHLHEAIRELQQSIPIAGQSRHAITMSGELVDLFDSRQQGVTQLLEVIQEHFPDSDMQVFVGRNGFQCCDDLQQIDAEATASVNWLATAWFVASRVRSGLLIDIGSTTTDIIRLSDHEIHVQGYTDYDRLRHHELVYTGIVRTPVMMLTNQVPFQGHQIPLIAEHFATTADIYRLCNELPAYADQMPTADQGDKTQPASARRLARMLGRDYQPDELDDWIQLAWFLRQQQLQQIGHACDKQIAPILSEPDNVIVGAGSGRFLVQQLASTLNLPYLDFSHFLPPGSIQTELNIPEFAPAFSVASLLQHV